MSTSFPDGLRCSGTATFTGTVNFRAGTIQGAALAGDGVPATALTTTLRTGYVPLPLTHARVIAANDIPNIAAIGGLLAADTAPILERVNGATDKQLRLRWAATVVTEIAWQFVYPPDLDDTQDVEVRILAAMSASADTPAVAIGYFEGVGDTNAGDNTAAVTGTAIAEYSVAVSAVDIGAAPKVASVSLTPAAHGTDAFLLYGAYVAYTRK